MSLAVQDRDSEFYGVLQPETTFESGRTYESQVGGVDLEVAAAYVVRSNAAGLAFAGRAGTSHVGVKKRDPLKRQPPERGGVAPPLARNLSP